MTLDARIDAVIDAALGSRIVGCVVLVRRDGQPVYARAAGLADREAGRVMRSDAVFKLASVTKPIVAAAALRMADLGLVGLDDSVTDYLPYFTPPSPDGVVRPILIRHLPTHTSGLTYDVGPDISTGSTSLMMRATCGQRWRGSSVPSRRPATENGWQGYPAERKSTAPRHGRPSKVPTSSQTTA